MGTQRSSLGDPSEIEGPQVPNPTGIRGYQDWSMAQLLYPEYVKEVLEMWTEAGLKNLEIYKQAVGDNIDIINISGTDLGTQVGQLLSVETFRELYKPCFKRLNDWVHQNTDWKVLYHSCGAIRPFLDDFVDMGVDIINPVQITAAGMDARELKDTYGDKLVFWGGGVDTQDTLPNKSPEQIAEHIKRIWTSSPRAAAMCLPPFTTLWETSRKIISQKLLRRREIITFKRKYGFCETGAA